MTHAEDDSFGTEVGWATALSNIDIHVDTKQKETRHWIVEVNRDARIRVEEILRDNRTDGSLAEDIEWSDHAHEFADNAIPYMTYRRWLYWVDLDGWQDPDPAGWGFEPDLEELSTITIPYLFYVCEQLFYYHKDVMERD